MIDYRRIDGESEDEFIYRICSAKDQIGSWDDVADILNKALGYNYGESKYRKTYQSFDRMFSANRSKFVDNSVLDEMEKSRIELEKERWRLSDVCREYSRLIREQAREDHWEEIIRDAVGRLEPRNYSAIRMSDKPHTGKDLLVSLCDIHYGTDIDNYWGKYNSSVCRAYLKNYLKQIIEIGESRGAENCYVWMNGDAISGNIHTGIRISNKENLMQQVMEVSELISWFLDELSLCFNHVYFLSVSGNHSRVDKKEDSVPSERLDDIVPWFIDARCANNNRVEVMKDARIDPTMWVSDIRGRRYVGVHGDYDNGVSALRTASMVDGKAYAILTGHLHHNKIDSDGGIVTAMAGSFEGVDTYCAGRRILSKPEQLVLVVDRFGIRSAEFVDLKEDMEESEQW